MSTESTTTETTPVELREALAAVLEGLHIPYAATVGHEETRQKILTERLRHVVVFLERVLDDDPHPNLSWSIRYLRERLAEHPAGGYVTDKEARAAIEHGASWSEAVAELREREICGPGCCSPVLGVHTSCPGPLVGRTVVSVK